jgi:hypothetical protein
VRFEYESIAHRREENIHGALEVTIGAGYNHSLCCEDQSPATSKAA